MPKGKHSPPVNFSVLDDTKEFLKVLKDWYAQSWGSGPSSGSLLFEDDRTFKEHLDTLAARYDIK
jgi:hypothetical protein